MATRITKAKPQTIGVLLLVAAFMQCNYCYGQESQPIQMQIYFQAGSSQIDLNYMNNRQTLRRVASVFTSQTTPYISSLYIDGYASPEGPMDGNMRLSQQRADAVRHYITDNYPYIFESWIKSVGRGENWDGLRNLVENDHWTPNRNQILYIIDNVPAKINYNTNTSRKKQIMDLGVPTWEYLLDNHFPQLRLGASLAIVVLPDTPAEVRTAIDNTLRGKTDTIYIEKPIYIEKQVYSEPQAQNILFTQSEVGFMIKTNILYLATTTPNMAMEFPLGSRWTLDLAVGLNVWDFGDNRGIRHGIARPEVRYWLDRRFERHFFGLYGMYGEYQIENIDPTASKRYDGSASGAGLSYGYQLPTKNRRIKWEFSISAGYLYIDYKEYNCNTCNNLLGKGGKHYFGPSKAAISLIYIIK